MLKESRYFPLAPTFVETDYKLNLEISSWCALKWTLKNYIHDYVISNQIFALLFSFNFEFTRNRTSGNYVPWKSKRHFLLLNLFNYIILYIIYIIKCCIKYADELLTSSDFRLQISTNKDALHGEIRISLQWLRYLQKTE